MTLLSNQEAPARKVQYFDLSAVRRLSRTCILVLATPTICSEYSLWHRKMLSWQGPISVTRPELCNA